ncbi:antibiotic biosynthesis monooxygenase family protein [Nonomuraea rubra]|uniref:Heme-degrading monooxygenase HmoA n=1 Tax=Nonomuraea rubra TaxID=46180 RepID=A0A7X0NTF2_9ACTN|nr:antibiotic biosynthesis monooxygenase [Nonomuraea rubra]MBB6549296.1 heme-degrading monooxygenase HmoA [Nonomuraea rubra]
MKVAMVAHHYPRAEHREEFVARVHRVAEVFRGTPGCLSAEAWLAGEAVVSIVRWESQEASAASLVAAQGAAGVDIAFDERESRPREIVQLVEA